MRKKLILLHGALGCEADLFNLKFHLEEKHDVHTFNFSGHGDLAKVQTEFSIEKFSDDLKSYLEKKQIKSCNIFGYSMGGYAALNYAVNSDITIGKIFTLGTKFNWSPEYAEQQSKLLNPDKLEEKVPKFANTLIKRHGKDSWKHVVAETASMMKRLGEKPLLDKESLSKINTHVLVTTGDKDDMVSTEESELTVNLLRNAAYKILVNTPHPIEKVDANLLANEISNYID